MSSVDSDVPYRHTYFEPPKTFVKSAVRVLGVLEHFYRSRQPARAVEISRDLDLPVSSTKYLLTSLVEAGYLTFDKQSKKYFPSILFTGFASWLASIYPGGEALRMLARDVFERFGEMTSIMVQHEDHMRALVIETPNGSVPPAYDFRVRIPLFGSASGRIALAAHSDEEVGQLVRREARKLAPELRETYDRIPAEVREVRQRGFAVRSHTVLNGEARETFIALAVPVPVARQAPPMALGIMGEARRLAGRDAELAAQLSALVDNYREALGCSSETLP